MVTKLLPLLLLAVPSLAQRVTITRDIPASGHECIRDCLHDPYAKGTDLGDVLECGPPYEEHCYCPTAAPRAAIVSRHIDDCATESCFRGDITKDIESMRSHYAGYCVGNGYTAEVVEGWYLSAETTSEGGVSATATEEATSTTEEVTSSTEESGSSSAGVVTSRTTEVTTTGSSEVVTPTSRTEVVITTSSIEQQTTGTGEKTISVDEETTGIEEETACIGEETAGVEEETAGVEEKTARTEEVNPGTKEVTTGTSTKVVTPGPEAVVTTCSTDALTASTEEVTISAEEVTFGVKEVTDGPEEVVTSTRQADTTEEVVPIEQIGELTSTSGASLPTDVDDQDDGGNGFPDLDFEGNEPGQSAASMYGAELLLLMMMPGLVILQWI